MICLSDCKEQAWTVDILHLEAIAVGCRTGLRKIRWADLRDQCFTTESLNSTGVQALPLRCRQQLPLDTLNPWNCT